MGRKIGLVLLGIFLVGCFIPAYTMAVVVPSIFIFGPNETLHQIEYVGVWVLSIATAIWVISRIWTPSPRRQRKSP